MYNHGKTINIHIVYGISKNYNISSYPKLEDCLFGAASLAKHFDILVMVLDLIEKEHFQLLMDLVKTA